MAGLRSLLLLGDKALITLRIGEQDGVSLLGIFASSLVLSSLECAGIRKTRPREKLGEQK